MILLAKGGNPAYRSNQPNQSLANRVVIGEHR